MGWRERYWARLDRSERRILFGSVSPRRLTTRGRRIGVSLFLTLAAVIVLVLGQLPAGGR